MIDRLRTLLRARRYRLTLHAEEERDADQISIRDIEAAFSTDSIELVEDYPYDPRGHSMLVLGLTEDGNPLHCVWSVHEDLAILITIYRPNPRLWTNWRRRKGRRS